MGGFTYPAAFGTGGHKGDKRGEMPYVDPSSIEGKATHQARVENAEELFFLGRKKRVVWMSCCAGLYG